MRLSHITLGFAAFLAFATGPAQAQSPYDRPDLQNVRVDCVRFERQDATPLRIHGQACDSSARSTVTLAAHVTVFGLTPTLSALEPGDEVMIRSTFAENGTVVASEVSVNVHTADVRVLGLHARELAVAELDYHTGLPLATGLGWGIDRAVLLGAAVLEHRDGSEGAVRAGDIAAGDKAKLYGFKRPGSDVMYVYRIEVR